MSDRSLGSYFADWEGHVFGFGYGSGEPHILPLLKQFFEAFGAEDRRNPNSYDYRKLELAVTLPVAWLFINALCKANMIEYGASPRFGWLTPAGECLREFIGSASADDLVHFVTERDADDYFCGPDTCNCGPDGYDPKRICPNPFWYRRT